MELAATFRLPVGSLWKWLASLERRQIITRQLRDEPVIHESVIRAVWASPQPR
jgi:uncharacterized membrane protein